MEEEYQGSRIWILAICIGFMFDWWGSRRLCLFITFDCQYSLHEEGIGFENVSDSILALQTFECFVLAQWMCYCSFFYFVICVLCSDKISFWSSTLWFLSVSRISVFYGVSKNLFLIFSTFEWVYILLLVPTVYLSLICTMNLKLYTVQTLEDEHENMKRYKGLNWLILLFGRNSTKSQKRNISQFCISLNDH